MAKAKKPSICKPGDRIQDRNGKWGTVTRIFSRGTFPYEITWDSNGRAEHYTQKNFADWGWTVHPPDPTTDDIEEEELAQFNQSELDFSRGYEWKTGDRALDSILGEVEILDVKEGMAKVLTSDNCDPWLSPAGTKALQPCLSSEISVAASALDSRLPGSSSEGLPLLAYASGMNTASQSFSSDTPAYQSTQTSILTPLLEVTTLQPSALPVSPSVFRENDSVQTMNETVSQLSSKSSRKTSRNSSRSKTSEAYSPAPTAPDTKSDTLPESSPSFPSAGTMRSGKWSEVASIAAPLLESGYYWLDSPGALSSSTSRPAGQSKLEASLKKVGHLLDGECINPAFLEDAFEIPLGWSDHSVSRSAIALLDEKEKPSVIALTPELPVSLSVESSTSTQSLLTEVEERSPDLSLEKPQTQTSKQTGSLYQYTANRAGKDGVIREYPLVVGRDRNRDDDADWYWGISYIEKVNGKWRDKSASIPRWSLPLARQLMARKFPLAVTIEASQLKWLWTTEIGDYLIGEVKPEICPRLAVISFGLKELFITGSGWGEATPIYRQRKREEISGAIAGNKPFQFIKELLK